MEQAIQIARVNYVEIMPQMKASKTAALSDESCEHKSVHIIETNLPSREYGSRILGLYTASAISVAEKPAHAHHLWLQLLLASWLDKYQAAHHSNSSSHMVSGTPVAACQAHLTD